AAMLAGVIRAPVATDPRRDAEAARVRRNQVLEAMGAPAEALAAPLGVIPPHPMQPTDPFAVEAAKREFLANPAFGSTEQDRRKVLLTGGVVIQTTIDPTVQAAARHAADGVAGSLG